MSPTTLARFTWASRILMLLSGLMGILAAADGLPAGVIKWAALGAALVAYGARWCEQQIPARKPTQPPAAPGAVVGCLLALLLVGGCGSPLKAAAHSTLAVAQARNMADTGLAVAFRARMTSCLAQVPATTYKACMDASAEQAAMVQWRDKARPAITAAIVTTYTALQLAQMAKADKPPPWEEYLKPAACGMVQALKQFGHLLPGGAAGILALLDTVKGVACVR